MLINEETLKKFSDKLKEEFGNIILGFTTDGNDMIIAVKENKTEQRRISVIVKDKPDEEIIETIKLLLNNEN